MQQDARGELFYPRQTNTALYVQLHKEGRSTADILRVQNVYRIAVMLFNGRYRKSERAFVCHAVGAGSSAAHFDPRIDVVISCMMHAAYDSGQFPDGKTGRASDVHREWLRGHLGAEVEAVVARYAGFKFETGVPERLVKTHVPKEDEDLLFMALLHELDDIADGGLTISPKWGISIESRVAACATLARRIGKDYLASTLERHGAIYKSLGWMDDLRRAELEGYRIAPNLRAYWRLRRDFRRGKAIKIL